jgi:hypothetical protein
MSGADVYRGEKYVGSQARLIPFFTSLEFVQVENTLVNVGRKFGLFGLWNI